MKIMKKIGVAAAASVVAAMSVVSLSASAAIEFDAGDKIISKEKDFAAYMCIVAGGDTQWKPGDLVSQEASFTEDGQYTVSATVANGSGSIECLILETDINAYSFSPDGATAASGSLPEGCTANVKIDSITVNQISGSSVTWAYNGPSNGALRLGDNGSSIRLNVLNEWTTPKVTDIEKDLSSYGGLAAGDTVVVTFSVSGISAGGNGEGTTAPNENGSDTTTTAATDANGNAVTTTTTAAGGNNNNNSGNNSNGNNSSNSNKSNSSSNNKSTNNAKTSETGDFGIAAVVLGAIATAALGAGAYTVTRRKK